MDWNICFEMQDCHANLLTWLFWGDIFIGENEIQHDIINYYVIVTNFIFLMPNLFWSDRWRHPRE